MNARNGYPQGQTYRYIHATMGQTAQQRPPTTPAPESQRVYQDGLRIIERQAFVEVPAWYGIAIQMGGNAGDEANGSVALRPERFELRRITYAAQADSPPFLFITGSATGNAVEVSWGDEFTRFLGEQAILLNALFGSNSGFLDMPANVLFQGRQSLNAKLRRLMWTGTDEPGETRIDIAFHGVGLLPANTGGVSGSL
jgi:hypothetical protein